MPTVTDELWDRIQPLLPVRPRRFRYPGRKPLDDRQVLNGILFVLVTGIGWEHLPRELGYGSGMTCWRRLRDWNAAGVWDRLLQILLGELREADQLDWSRALVDSSHVRAIGGTTRPDRARSIAAGQAPSITSSPTRTGCRSRVC
jgi:transposase